MWDAIRRNRRRSLFLICLMGILLILLGFSIGMSFDPQAGGGLGALVALGIWFFMTLVGLAGGDSILLQSCNARRIEKQDAPQLWNVVEEMSIASGLSSIPNIYIIDQSAPNAFAVGRNPKNATVAITTGLLKRLNRDELQGVIAHEIGHVKNLDIRFMTLASVMLGSIVLISDVFLRSLRYSNGRRSSRSSGGNQAQLIFLLIAILLVILAPLLAQILYFSCSRQREYLADASAARFTRYPEGLASALEKIDNSAQAMKKQTSRIHAPLYIVNPLQSRSAFSLFSTHPPTEKRIAILRSMGGNAAFQAYEQAYRQVLGARKHCLDERTLREDTPILSRSPLPEAAAKPSALQYAQEAIDVFDRALDYLFIPCPCGIRIKIPPEFQRHQIPCPRCGRIHTVPSAESLRLDEGQVSETPLHYQRKTTGWESFQCACSKTIQLSPSFSGQTVTCSQCGQKIEIFQA